MSSRVSLNLVVLNGEKYIRHFLDSVLAQTYPHELIELNILDNGSSDNTINIVENSRFQIPDSGFLKVNFIFNKINLGMWPGQEELLRYSNGKYVVTTAVDIILARDFIKNAVETMEKNPKIGALQPKIYKFEVSNDKCQMTNVLDTCGFQIFRSRRIVNIGHGLTWEQLIQEQPSFAKATEGKEIFAVEGAVPVFKKEALENCRIRLTTKKATAQNKVDSEITDHDYFWYGDDLDLAWRMRLFGWKEVFASDVIAWHDRQTTKTLKKSWSDYITRVPIRKQIPIKKRRLDWRNTRWTLVKNDYTINILKDLPWIVSREIAVLGYAVLFEPGILKEIPTFFKHLLKMLKKRKEIMRRAVADPKEIRKWIN